MTDEERAAMTDEERLQRVRRTRDRLLEFAERRLDDAEELDHDQAAVPAAAWDNLMRSISMALMAREEMRYEAGGDD